MKATLSTKGQVTLPKAVRDRLRLKSGDRVKFFYHPDGYVVILPTLPASELRKGFEPRNQVTVSVEEMDDAVEASAAEENASLLKA